MGIAIRDSAHWGKGLGYLSSPYMIDYALNHLKISEFTAETHEMNVRARKMLENLGFKEISRIGSEEYIGEVCQLIQYKK